MFAKLLKYEWRANRGLMGLLTLAVLGIGILATVFLRVLVNYGDALTSSGNVMLTMATMGMGVSLFFSVVALFIYLAAVQVVLLYRFYKHKFTDEGYLTFTLPVKTESIFWSSLLHMLLWSVISGAVVILLSVLALLIGTSRQGLFNMEIFETIEELLRLLVELQLPWADIGGEIIKQGYLPAMILNLLSFLLSPLYAMILPMACITVGSILAKRHKILASIGVYYGVNLVQGIVTSMATTIPSLLFISMENIPAYYTTVAAISLLITLVVTVGGYLLSIRLMKHKLNLP